MSPETMGQDRKEILRPGSFRLCPSIVEREKVPATLPEGWSFWDKNSKTAPTPTVPTDKVQ